MLQPPFALPCRHCAAQAIGFAAAKPSGDHRKLHHLFLKNRHAECSLKHASDSLARVANSLSPTATVEVGMHHLALNRTWSHDRDLYHEVVVTTRFKPRQHTHLRARLDLKHADSVGGAHHVVNRGVFGGNILDRERLVAVVTHEVEALAYRTQHAQREHVDLQ